MEIKEIIEELEELKTSLRKEILICQIYLRKRNDFGQVRRPDDPMETISFTRGKNVGLIIAFNKTEKLLKKLR